MSKRVTRSETQHRQQQSAIIPDPSRPPADGACVWWHLPRELRGKVLKLAYGRDSDAPMKPIMGVDFLRDEIGFVTTDLRRGKLPKLPSTFNHYTSRFLISKRWHREALAAFFSSSVFDLTRRNRFFNFISPYASSLNNIKTPLPGLEHLVSIRVRMSEPLCAGVELLAKSCPQLSRIELHAESRDFEGHWFEAVVIPAESSGHNTRQITRTDEETNAINRTHNFFSDLQDMSSTLASRRSARIWRESLTLEFLVTTRWYAEIQHLSGLQEATLMLTQKSHFWEAHTLAEDNNFSWNLWKIRWILLMSATRLKWGKIELPLLLGNGDGGSASDQLLRERECGKGHNEGNGEEHGERRGEGHGGRDGEGNSGGYDERDGASERSAVDARL